MIHELKTWPKYYKEVINGNKNFEVRKDDRNFKEGDILKLQEYRTHGYGDIPSGYTGRSTSRKVTYILQGGAFGVEKGFVVLGLRQ